MDICHICLRTDRKLKAIDTRLSGYHDELCEYTLSLFPLYCLECEHLLLKAYNFKKKCTLASNVLQNYKKLNTAKDLLYTLLPPVTFGISERSNAHIYNYVYEEKSQASSDGEQQRRPDEGFKIQLGPKRTNKEPVPNDTTGNNLEPSIRYIFNDSKAMDSNGLYEDEIKTENVTEFTEIDITVSNVEDYLENHEELNVEGNLDEVSDEEYTLDKEKSIFTKKVVKGKVTDNNYSLLQSNDNASESANGLCETNPKFEIYSNERLKANLSRKFEACEELKTEDGTVIDKQYILDIIDKEEPSKDYRRLWNIVQYDSILSPKALSLLKRIQDKENEIRSVFEIQYLNTMEQVLEEFEKRKTYEAYTNAEFTCDYCHQWFELKKNLEHHMKCHIDVKAGEFLCEICKMRKRTKTHLIKHMKTHIRIYRCKLCPLVTNYRLTVLHHIKQHKGVQYKREHCNRAYKSKSGVSAHQTNSCSEDKHRIECTQCGRTFRHERGLWLHTRLKHLDSSTLSVSDISSNRVTDVQGTEMSYEVTLQGSEGFEPQSDRNKENKLLVVTPLTSGNERNSEQTSIGVEEFTRSNIIESILKRSHRGRALLRSEEAIKGLLDTRQRKDLAHLILDSVLDEDPNVQLTWPHFESWSRGIADLFSYESPILYYAPYIPAGPYHAKKNASGILYHTYLRKRKNLIKRKVTTPFRKRRAASESNDLSSDEGTPKACPIDLSIIEEYDSDLVEQATIAISIAIEGTTPWQEIDKSWAITTKMRLQKLYYEKLSLTDYLNKYKVLKGPSGYKLLIADFDRLYPATGAEILRNSLENVAENIIARAHTLLNTTKDVFLRLALTELLNSVVGEDLENITTISLLLLPLLMNITPTKRKGVKKPSKSLIRDSFILRVSSTSDLEARLGEQQETLKSFNVIFQPFIVCIGESVTSIEKCFVILEDTCYELPNIVAAVDTTFKIFHATATDYPVLSHDIWLFLQKGFYDIERRNDNCMSQAVKTFLVELGFK